MGVKSTAGGACFVVVGMAVTTVLLGKDVPETRTAAYFVNGQMVTEGRNSLDLSRPIFVREDMPVCPTEDARASYSPGDTEGCVMMSADTAAGLLGIITNGMRQPTFQMQMKTRDGTIRGWVDYNDLTN